MADDIAVMYAGRIVETASAEDLFAAPEHPYTWGLLQSIPTLAVSARGRLWCRSRARPPSLIRRPSGCHFHPRCPYAQPDHSRIDPSLDPVPERPSHHVACLLEAQVRQQLWQQLRAGRMPEEALAAVASSEGIA